MSLKHILVLVLFVFSGVVHALERATVSDYIWDEMRYFKSMDTFEIETSYGEKIWMLDYQSAVNDLTRMNPIVPVPRIIEKNFYELTEINYTGVPPSLLGECVSFVKGTSENLAKLGTSKWKIYKNIDEKNMPKAGDIIATFKSDGKYGNDSGTQHAAVVLAVYSESDVAWVMDQNYAHNTAPKTVAVHKFTLKNDGKVNDLAKYSIVGYDLKDVK